MTKAELVQWYIDQGSDTPFADATEMERIWEELEEIESK